MRENLIKQSLLSASVITLSANGLGRFIGFFREAVIADHYGTSSFLDTFIIAFTAPELVSLIIYAALPTAIVAFQQDHTPGALEEDDTNIFWRGLVSFGVILAVVWLFIWLFKDNIIEWIAPDLNEGYKVLGAKLLTILAPFAFFRGLEAYVRGWLFKKKHFLIPALTPFILNAGILSAIFILHDRLDILALAYGWLAGSIMIFFINSWMALKVIGRKSKGSKTSVHVYNLLRLAFTIGIVEAISFAYPTVDRYLASRFLGEGQIAALRYSSFLMQVAPGVLIVTFTTASFPWIADYSNIEKLAQLKRLYTRSIGLILYVITPVAIGMVIFAREIVQLAFQRGAFDWQSVELTVGPFVCYTLGMLFISVYIYQMRYYYADRMIGRLGFILFIMLTVKIVASYLLVHPYEQNGLAIATSLAWLSGFICMTVDLSRKMGSWVFLSLAASLRRILPLAGILISGWLLADYVLPSPVAFVPLMNFLRLLIFGISGITLYLFVSHLLRITEFKDISVLVNSKFRGESKSG